MSFAFIPRIEHDFHLSQKPSFPENATPDSIAEFIDLFLKEEISKNLIYRPWNIKHTKNFDNEVNYLVCRLIDEIRIRYGHIQIAKNPKTYFINSKFSRRKRKKLYLGEFRKFKAYNVRVEDCYKNYRDLCITTHDLLKNV